MYSFTYSSGDRVNDHMNQIILLFDVKQHSQSGEPNCGTGRGAPFPRFADPPHQGDARAQSGRRPADHVQDA